MWIKERSAAVFQQRRWLVALPWLVIVVVSHLAMTKGLTADPVNLRSEIKSEIPFRANRNAARHPLPSSAPVDVARHTQLPAEPIENHAFDLRQNRKFLKDVESPPKIAANSRAPEELDLPPAPDSTPPRPTAPSGPPWWQQAMLNQLRVDTNTMRITLEQVFLRAIENSPQISVISEVPLIRKTGIVEAEAAFDPTAFVESRWDQFDNPVGNTLTTGGPNRYLNNNMTSSVGMRQRTAIGGQLELAQQFGWQQTNSKFFVPSPQGNSRLALNYTQPLLRGSGKQYNESLIFLAQIDANAAEDEFSGQLQAHLLEVARAYWNLYLERAGLAQKQRSYRRSREILDQLGRRIEIDAVMAQVQRAEAEVAMRQSELLWSEMAVKNAESRLRSLVCDPLMGEYDDCELIPVSSPTCEASQIDLVQSVTTAIELRPEISQSIKQIKAGCVRLDMSKNELLPILNLITQTYVAGLEGGGSIGDALADQFRAGNPSYSVGLQYEVPLGRRAAFARLERRSMEIRQFRKQYESTVRALRLEVEIAVRAVQTSYNEMIAQKQAMDASTIQMEYLESRWRLRAGDTANGSVALENLMIAQERVVKTEFAYLQSQTTYTIALIALKRATGEFLQAEGVTWTDYMDECESVKSRLILKPPLDGVSPGSK